MAASPDLHDELAGRQSSKSLGLVDAMASRPEVAQTRGQVAPALRVIKPKEVGREFDIASSFGLETNEVMEVTEAHKDKMRDGEVYQKGRPVAIYEIMQGMYDYGRMHSPSPRVHIKYKDGSEAVFDGSGGFLQGGKKIAAIEFRNAGPGLAPDDLLIARHGGGDKTIGDHGRGTTVALTYLASQGMNVSVDSNYNGQAWSACTSLVDTESGQTKVLAASGAWGEVLDSESLGTVFRIENPTDRFCQELARMSGLFLYANPVFEDAVIVEPNEDAVPLERISVDKGEVLCLHGVESYNVGNVRDIYVDGLKLPLNGCFVILPWAVSDLVRASDDMYRVRRSQSSTGVDASNLPLVIGTAVANLRDRSLLKLLIDKGISFSNYDYLLEFRAFSGCSTLKLSSETAALVKSIWEENYGDAYITSEKYMVDKYGAKHNVRLIGGHCYQFLLKAGVKPVSDISDELSVKDFSSGDLDLPFIKDENAFNKFLEMVVWDSRGEAVVSEVSVSGRKCLCLRFPGLMLDVDAISSSSQNNYGRLLRISAALAHVSGLQNDIFAISAGDHGGRFHDIKIQTSSYMNDKYCSFVRVSEFDIGKYPDFSSFEPGFTYVLFDFGEEEPDFTPEEQVDPRKLDKLLAFYEKIMASVRQRFGSVPHLEKLADTLAGRARASSAGLRFDFGDVPHGSELRDLFGAMSGSMSGFASRLDGSSVGNVSGEAVDPYESEINVMLSGYYKGAVRSAVRLLGDRLFWESVQDYVPVEVPFQSLNDGEYECRQLVPRLNGIKRLQVLCGHKIIAYETGSGSVSIYRDRRTGDYCARGNASNLIYYTAPDDPLNLLRYSAKAPLESERTDVIDYRLLNPDVAKFIQSHINLPVEDKLRAALDEWGRSFAYHDGAYLDSQATGSHVGQVAAQILNTAKGICNLSATGFVLLLRALKIPARMCVGYFVGADGNRGSHAWIEYWNGHMWMPLEEQLWVKVESATTALHPSDIFEGGTETSSDLEAARAVAARLQEFAGEDVGALSCDVEVTAKTLEGISSRELSKAGITSNKRWIYLLILMTLGGVLGGAGLSALIGGSDRAEKAGVSDGVDPNGECVCE